MPEDNDNIDSNDVTLTDEQFAVWMDGLMRAKALRIAMERSSSMSGTRTVIHDAESFYEFLRPEGLR